MVALNLNEVHQFMKRHKYDAHIQSETDQVYVILKLYQREYPLFLRIFETNQLLQLIAFIPTHLYPQGEETPLTGTALEEKQKKNEPIIADLARLLHMLNKEIDIPGFGMDEASGAVFYRIMVPAPKKKIDEDLLLAFLRAIEYVCPMFSPPIEGLSAGQMTLNQIISKAKEFNKSL